MQKGHGLRRIVDLDVAALRHDAEQAGLTVFVLPTVGIVDRTTFFDAARSSLPLEPALVGTQSWDALADSLWEGLYEHRARSVAIIWKGAYAMATRAPSEFATAQRVLADVASLLADPLATKGRTKELAIFVEEPAQMG